MAGSGSGGAPSSCILIKGDTRVAQFKRSVTKAVVSQLTCYAPACNGEHGLMTHGLELGWHTSCSPYHVPLDKRLSAILATIISGSRSGCQCTQPCCRKGSPSYNCVLELQV